MKNRSTSDFYIHGRLVRPQLNRIAPAPGSDDGGDVGDIQLEPKIMQVLTCLAERSGEVVSKDELMEAAWPDVVVTDDVLARAIYELRKAFGDDPRDPSVIETIRKRGYRLIADVRDASEVNFSPSPSRYLWLAVAAIVALALFLLIARPFRTAGTGLSHSVPVPLTSFAGQEITPALSPDGRYVAYSWNGEAADDWDVYVQEIGAHGPKRLTDDPADDGSPAWSPDGRHVAFIRRSDSTCAMYVVPVLGGASRRIGSCRDTNYADLEWSPDGRLLAFNDAVGADRAHSIMLMSPETGDVHRLTYPPESIWGDFDPAFSPDGRRVAFARALSEGLQELYVVGVDGGAASRLLSEGRNLYGITWSADGEEVIFSSNLNGTYDLWGVPATGGRPRLILSDQQHLVNPSTRGHNGRLVYELRSYDVDIRRYDVLGRKHAGAVSASTRWEMYPAYSPDGRRLAFISDRSGSYELWVSIADGTDPLQLTFFEGPLVSTPRWSPDGRRIAFDARPNGHGDVFVVDAEGGRAEPVVRHDANDLAPFWSPDGRRLYFGSDRSGRWEIWEYSLSGNGEAVRLTQNGGFSGRISPDGSTLFYTRNGEAGLRQVPVGGGAESVVLDDLDPGDWGNWDLIGDDLYFVDRGDSVAVLRMALSTGARDHVFNLPRITPTHDIGLAVSPDAETILYPTITRRDADVMMVGKIR